MFFSKFWIFPIYWFLNKEQIKKISIEASSTSVGLSIEALMEDFSLVARGMFLLVYRAKLIRVAEF